MCSFHVKIINSLGRHMHTHHEQKQSLKSSQLLFYQIKNVVHYWSWINCQILCSQKSWCGIEVGSLVVGFNTTKDNLSNVLWCIEQSRTAKFLIHKLKKVIYIATITTTNFSSYTVFNLLINPLILYIPIIRILSILHINYIKKLGICTNRSYTS